MKEMSVAETKPSRQTKGQNGKRAGKIHGGAGTGGNESRQIQNHLMMRRSGRGGGSQVKFIYTAHLHNISSCPKCCTHLQIRTKIQKQTKKKVKEKKTLQDKQSNHKGGAAQLVLKASLKK